MKLSRSSLALALLSLALPTTGVRAGQEQVLGKWECIAQSPEGELASVWSIQAKADALVVEVEIEMIKRPAQEVELKGPTLTMKVPYQSVAFDVSVTFDGDTFAGTWTGDGRQGQLKGKRVPAS